MVGLGPTIHEFRGASARRANSWMVVPSTTMTNGGADSGERFALAPAVQEVAARLDAGGQRERLEVGAFDRLVADQHAAGLQQL